MTGDAAVGRGGTILRPTEPGDGFVDRPLKTGILFRHAQDVGEAGPSRRWRQLDRRQDGVDGA
jgi:hypothetical protein